MATLPKYMLFFFKQYTQNDAVIITVIIIIMIIIYFLYVLIPEFITKVNDTILPYANITHDSFT